MQATLHLAQEAAGIGVWECSPASGIMHWSPEQFTIYGVKPEKGPPRYREWLALIEPEDRSFILEAEHSLRAGVSRALHIEYRIRRPSDGAQRWLLGLGRLLPGPAGQGRIVGVNFDMTELRHTSSQLSYITRLLHMAQTAVGIGLWEVEPGTANVTWSPEQFALYGMDPAQPALSYKEWLAVVHPDDRAALLQAQKMLLAGETQALHREFRITRADTGEERWLAALGQMVTDPVTRTTRMVGVCFDITGLRQAESELRRTTDLLHAIGNCSPDAIYAKDMQGRFLYVNPAFSASVKRAMNEIIGHTNAEWQDNAAEAAAIMEADAAIMRSGESRTLEEIITVPGRGTIIDRSAKAPLRNSKGEVIGLVGISSDITRLKSAVTALRHSEAQFRATFEQAAVGMAHVELDGTLIRVNQRLCDMLGYARYEIMRLTFREVTHPDDVAASEAALQKFLAGKKKAYRTEKRYVRKDGATIWVTLTVSFVRGLANGMPHCVAVIEDITQRKLAEFALLESEARARRLFDHAPLPSYLVDPHTKTIVDCNEAATAMLGYSRDELRGMPLAQLDLTLEHQESILLNLQTSDKPCQFESRHRTRAGDVRDVVVAVVPALGPGRRLAHGTVIDISDRKRAEADLKNQAEHDQLTGLASRNWFFAALEAAVNVKPGKICRPGAVILADVDYFKQVNDTLGHDAGDALLIEIGRRLRAKCRADDIPARLGGDEFALLIPGIRDERAITTRMADILAAMAQPIDIAGRQLHVTVSIGATSFPRDGAGPKDLMKNADLALYEAKRSGRSCWRFFRPEQAAAMERHVQLANALRGAIENRQIQVAFQPKRTLTGRHAGFEALARWHDGERWVPPGEFIPIAEDTGLIRPLGRLITDLALHRLRSLRTCGRNPGHVAVNVTGADLLDPDYIADLRASLRRHRVAPSELELEVTETVLLGRTADRVDAVLRELRAVGVSIALDDFGTGFASLAHISRISVDRLKIDRSFVAGIGHDCRAGIIARTIIALARDLDMESIAEGVETEAQLEFLHAEGCGAVQGYLIAPPLMTEAEAASYLKAG